MKKYYATIHESKSGPAYGCGHSPTAARKNASLYGFDFNDGIVIEITRDSYDAINNGNPDAVTEATDTTRKTYAIIRRRDWYGPSRTTDIVTRHAGTWDPLTFDSPRAAREWVAEQEAQPYHLANNETARPTFHVTTVGSARFLAAYQAMTGKDWTDD